jgi:hypothetical protein
MQFRPRRFAKWYLSKTKCLLMYVGIRFLLGVFSVTFSKLQHFPIARSKVDIV